MAEGPHGNSCRLGTGGRPGGALSLAGPHPAGEHEVESCYREDEKCPPQIREDALENGPWPENGGQEVGGVRHEAVVGCGPVEEARSWVLHRGQRQ